MLSVRTNGDPCLPTWQSEPLSPEEEVRLEWLFCLARCLERIRISVAPTEPAQAHVEALVVLGGNPSLKLATVVFRAA